MKLSKDLKKWRAERPDEWTMDRFIEKANILEHALQDWLDCSTSPEEWVRCRIQAKKALEDDQHE